MIATVAFEEAAVAQATALGFAPAVHFVPHPIQQLTGDELAALADDAVVEVLALLAPGDED